MLSPVVVVLRSSLHMRASKCKTYLWKNMDAKGSTAGDIVLPI